MIWVDRAQSFSRVLRYKKRFCLRKSTKHHEQGVISKVTKSLIGWKPAARCQRIHTSGVMASFFFQRMTASNQSWLVPQSRWLCYVLKKRSQHFQIRVVGLRFDIYFEMRVTTSMNANALLRHLSQNALFHWTLLVIGGFGNSMQALKFGSIVCAFMS